MPAPTSPGFPTALLEECVCSGSRISVCGDSKPVAMPPCSPRWCTVPQARWVSSKPLLGDRGWAPSCSWGQAAFCSPENPEESKGWDFGRRRASGWILPQGALHPKAGHLLQPAELWRFLGQMKVWEHLCFPGGTEKGLKPSFPAQTWRRLQGVGWGSLGTQLLQTNQNVTARRDDGQSLWVSIAKHTRNENPTFCLSIGLFLNIQTSGAREPNHGPGLGRETASGPRDWP